MRVALVALGLCACGGGRIFAGPAVSSAQVVIEPANARFERDRLTVRLAIDNRAGGSVRVEPHRFSLVAPDGSVYTEAGAPRTVAVAAGESARVVTRFRPLPLRLANAPGFFVRLDGFELAGAPIDVAPVALGHPVTGADGKVRIRRPARAAPAPVVMEGDRRCAVLPLGDDDVRRAVRARVEAAGWTVVTADSLSPAALDAAAGCRAGECIREIGGDLGVAYLIGGAVEQIDGERALTLRLMRVADGTVSGRADALLFPESETETVAALDRAVAALVGLD